MIIVEAQDYGGAPEIAITGPCEIERISAGQVRVSYYAVFRGERRIVAHLIWDWQIFMRALDLYIAAIPTLLAEPVSDENTRRVLAAH